MFGLNLSLPEHVNMSLDPNPEDGGATFVLVIQAKAKEGDHPVELRKNIPRDIGAVQFGKDLMSAINYLYQKTQKG